MRALKLLRMLLQESFARTALARTPEPTQLMNRAGQIDAFHQQGIDALVPVYHFNALATSRLTPAGGTVVDLGSGSARYLGYLAARRPDLRIIGIELAPAMVAVGRMHLERLGLAGRVDLRLGDMTVFTHLIPERVDTISSVFSLHHLPTQTGLAACLNQMSGMRERDGSAVWIFDHARPRHPATLSLFPQVFTPHAPPAFNEDSSNSLAAAFTLEELRQALVAASLTGGRHHLSRWMRLYQAHAYEGRSGVDKEAAGSPGQLDQQQHKQWRGLRSLFPDVAVQASKKSGPAFPADHAMGRRMIG